MHTYKDTRGALVPEERMEALFKSSGQTEEKWRKFIGEENSEKDGFLLEVLQFYCPMKEWYLGR